MSTMPVAPHTSLDPLTDAMNKAGSDKGTLGHGYTPFYNAALEDARLRVRAVLEVGIGWGASLTGWARYFPKAIICGIDLVPFLPTSGRIRTARADQSHRFQLQAAARSFGLHPFNVIVDDGGHTMVQQQVSLAVLLPLVAPGGVYILEDLHTSLRGGEYGVREDGQNSTLALIKHLREEGERPKALCITDREVCSIRAAALEIEVFSPRDGSITAIVRRR